MLDKLQSLKDLKKNGLPVLPYIILSRKNYIQELKGFIVELNNDRVMIRTDGKGKYSPSINNAELSEKLLNKIEEYFNKGYFVFASHPGNIYRNFHSLNILKNMNGYTIEAVGPGFIATDLNRRGAVHERVEIDKHSSVIFQKTLISKDEYLDQVKTKIKELGQIIAIDNKSYLLEHSSYVPLSIDELNYLTVCLGKLEKTSESLRHGSKTWVASMSFIDIGNGNEPIFWDLYVL